MRNIALLFLLLISNFINAETLLHVGNLLDTNNGEITKAVTIKIKDNKIIEGNPDKIKQVIDYWKFTRNILKKGPNWYLSEIISK